MKKTKSLCPHCNTGRLQRGQVELTRHVNGYTFTGEVPGEVCPVCDESTFAQRDLSLFDARIALILADAGIKHPEVLRYFRKVLGLRDKELATLLGVAAATVSNWESGDEEISRTNYAVLRQLVREEREGLTEMADGLRALRKPKKLPKKMRVEAA